MQGKKVLIIGSGIAGSMVSKLLQKKYNVIILTKEKANISNSMLAQGGIAVALDENDSPLDHYEDTLIAGCYSNDPASLKKLVMKGPEVVQHLIDDGLSFDKNPDGSYSYGLEGAHKRERILHIGGDKTGKKMTEFIQDKLKNVELHENTTVVDILSNGEKCIGVKALNDNNELVYYYSDYVVLATGGIGQLYPLTTNADTITGDGIAMAYRAGCELNDMEFMQFHPTLLSIEDHCYGLISEAVRGEGAVLVRDDGSRIMKGKHKYEDLAPRDIVSREITREISQGENVFLDISNIPNFESRFPAITENLIDKHIPFRKTKRIPIHPGAHFFMGGIKTDLNGETSLRNLFSIGESACTGVHGANRLASNSLLEAIVFAESVANAIDQRTESMHQKNITEAQIKPYKNDSSILDTKNTELNLPNLNELKENAWKCIGINRTEENLYKFIDWISSYDIFEKIPDLYLTRDTFECQNLALISYLIAKSSLNRKDSIGAHYITKGINQNEPTFS